MKKILAFGASNSKNSINKKLALWASSQVKNAEVTFIDLNDYPMPIYGIDREKDQGFPENAVRFSELVHNADGIIVSFAEHNGSYTAVFKNTLDWLSRVAKDAWGNKPVFCLSTSPGGRGGSSVLAAATGRIPFNGGQVAGQFSLPSFYDNFSEDKGIMEEALLENFQKQLAIFEQQLHQ